MSENKNNTTMTPAPADQAPAVQQENMSERFTKKVLQEFGSTVSGAMEVTDFQRRLIQGYFIMIDRALKTAEEERIRKNKANSNHDYDNNLPATWQNVNLGDLALDLVHYARMGLDMQQDAMLYPVPYKNNKANLYDITLMPGYNGIKYTAIRYALEAPIGETIELVYSTDTFVPHKKDSAHPVATYEFQINNPFDRGEIVGGFGYLEFAEPAKHDHIDYETRATPRHMTADGVPVFCAYDAIVPLEELRPNPGNPNHHGTDQIKRLASVIWATGWRNAITVSRQSGMIVKGHGRMEAAQLAGMSEAPVEYQDYDSEAEEWADLIADNRLAELSTLNTGELLEMVNEIDTGVKNSKGRAQTTYDTETRAILRGVIASADPKAVARYSQTGHPCTHQIVQRGGEAAKPGDRLVHGHAHYYILGVDNVAAMGVATIYYAEERLDLDDGSEL